MESYLEIRLLPDPEFPAGILMNALFTKLHRGLVAYGGYDIGVSFPDVGLGGRSLGARLRLHGSASSLGTLMGLDWAAGMRDHMALSAILPVPPQAKNRVVRRVQAKSNPDRERRRLVARKQVTVERAMELIPSTEGERLDLPYLILASRSTGQQFRLFVEHQPIQDMPVKARFSAYGLSPVATVPWF